MATEAPAGGRTDRRATVERYRRPARWFHAGVYLSTLVLLITGWWLTLGHEGQPSFLSAAAGVPDTVLHTWTGWVLTAIVGLGLLLRWRAAARFVKESVEFEPGDGRWLAGWPKAVFTGRFRFHNGRYDPGQRIANVVLVVLLGLLVASGVAMALLHGGPAFVVLVRVHTWSTYAVTPVILGHILVAAGILPGYRGVWRSMHLGGRLPVAVARRLWPGWMDDS